MSMSEVAKTTEYKLIHKYIIRTYGNAPLCIWDDSHISRFEWANISGVYTRELEDYLPMCVSCHRKFDITDDGIQRNIVRFQEWNVPRRIPIAQYKDGILVKVFESAYHASKDTGLPQGNISRCVRGQFKQIGGYQWARLQNDYTML